MTIASNIAATARRPSRLSPPLYVADVDESFRLHQHPAYWRWLELFQADRTASILHHPDYLFHDVPALKELKDRPAYVLAESDCGTGWAAGLIPKTMTLSRFAGCGSKPVVRGYRLVGDRPFGNGAPENLNPFFAGIEKHLLDREIEFLLIEDVVSPSPIGELLVTRRSDGFLAVQLLRSSPRYGIRLTSDPDAYWKNFSKNARKQNRKILAETQSCRLWRVSEVSDVDELLRAAHTVAENSWQRQRLRELLGANDDLLQRLTFLAQHQALRSYVMYDGERPIAFELNTQFNGELLSETAAYDAGYAHIGPGRALLLRVLEDLFAFNTPALYDFGSGDWEYKKRFSNDCRTSTKLWLVRRTMRHRFFAAMIGCEQRLRIVARQLVDRIRRTKSS